MTHPIMVKIDRIVDEAPAIKTFYFKHVLQSKPGQFVMLWVPGVGEKPISIASDSEDECSFTICAVGPFSNHVHTLKPGDRLGIKGPLGTSFSIAGNSLALVAGGYGAAPMAYLAEMAIKQGMSPENVHYCVGARNKELLLFEQRMADAGVQVHIATDDGSKGTQGFVTQVLREVIAKHGVDMIYTCGPELMEKGVYDIACELDINCEISLERYMKCGIGICGSCTVDPPGLCMCIDGPVISKKLASQIKEFGVYHRDASGKKIHYMK